MTRRQMLRRAGAGAAGLGVAGTLGGTLSGTLAPARGRDAPARALTPGPPPRPRWKTRPELQIPTLKIIHQEHGVSSDPIFIAPYNAPAGQAGAVIVANTGQAVWENPLAGAVTTNFRVQRYRSSPVLTWWEGDIELGHGVGEYVIADARYRTVRRVQAGRGLRGDLHEFVITARDTALLTSYALTTADLTAVGGSREGSIQDAIFQEIDLASGRVLLEWHSLEHIPLAESYAPVSANWDFFHINSVAVDGDGDLLISSRSTHTVYKLDSSGEIVWRLGGKHSDFAMGPGSRFAWQHDARRRDDGTLSVFDNGATPAVERLSRALILDVDERTMSASLLRQYTHPQILAGSQGSVQPLPNGNVFVGWGEAPRVSEFHRSGHMLFDALLGEQYQSYRAFRLPWKGIPAEAPAIAVSGTPDERTVYASWNGATHVHAWQLLAANHHGAPTLVCATPSQGFESALPARSAGPRLFVRALDRAGTTVGQSRTVTVAG